MIFKPAWKSEKLKKAAAGVEKLKKQDEIFQACLHFSDKLDCLFPRVYYKLTDPNQKKDAAVYLLSRRFDYPDWLSSHWKVVSEILGDLRKNEVMVPVLAELHDSKYKDTRLFIDLLRNELKINKSEYLSLTDRANNPIIRALAVVTVYGDEAPESVFRESEEFLDALLKFCSSRWATKNYNKFPENLQFSLIREGLLDDEALAVQARKKNVPALVHIRLSLLREVVKKMDKAERIQFLEWYIEKVPQKTWMEISVFDLEKLCLELLKDDPTPEEIVCYYYGLLKMESKEIYFKEMMAAKKSISKADDTSYYSKLMDEMEKNEDLKNRKYAVFSLFLNFRNKLISDKTSLYKRLSRIAEQLCTELMDDMEKEKDLDKLGNDISSLFIDFKQLKISEDSSFYSRLIKIAEWRESMIIDGLDQDNDLIKRKERIVHLFQDFRDHRIPKNSPIKKRLSGIIDRHDSEVVAFLNSSILTFQEKLDNAELIVDSDIHDREITLIHRSRVLSNDTHIMEKIDSIQKIRTEIFEDPQINDYCRQLYSSPEAGPYKSDLITFQSLKTHLDSFNKGDFQTQISIIKNANPAYKEELVDRFIKNYPDYIFSHSETKRVYEECPTCKGQGEFNAGMEWCTCMACSGYGHRHKNVTKVIKKTPREYFLYE